jgi:signal transduction histidine kinase
MTKVEDFAEDRTSVPELIDGMEQQRITAAILGALAHEVNNPLQGILSLTSVLGRECEAQPHSQIRLEQIRSGLRRVVRVVESFSVAYGNLPRPPDELPLERLLEWLGTSLMEQQFRVESSSGANGTTRILCLGPEMIRLIGDALSFPAVEQRTIRLRADADGDDVILICERPDPSGVAAEWDRIDGTAGFSGLAVLLHEMITLCGGEAAFRWDDTSLSGIRLTFRTRMG